jgi:hypothetical protein
MRLVRSVEHSHLSDLIHTAQVLSGNSPFKDLKQPWRVPLEVIKGTRPGIPTGISSKMMELWNIAQACWSSHPRDRPSLPMVLGKLNTFASLEAVTPFELREPKPMQMIGELSHFLLPIVILKSVFIRARNRNYDRMAGAVNQRLSSSNATGHRPTVPTTRHFCPPRTSLPMGLRCR